MEYFFIQFLNQNFYLCELLILSTTRRYYTINQDFAKKCIYNTFCSNLSIILHDTTKFENNEI